MMMMMVVVVCVSDRVPHTLTGSLRVLRSGHWLLLLLLPVLLL